MPTIRIGALALLLLAGAVLAPRAGRQSAQTAIPVYEEPRHHLVFRNAWVRVLDVRVPAGDTTLFHLHAAPVVGIAILKAATRTQFLGAPFDTIEPPGPVPAVLDNWSLTLPYTHRAVNVDSVPFHYVVGEWLKSPGIDATITPADSTMVLVKEGRTARVWSITIPAHGSTAMHLHAAPGLTILAVAGSLVREGGQPAAIGGSGAGTWSWRNPGVKHLLKNTGPKPIIVYEIDWR